jgi:hypothetical protein
VEVGKTVLALDFVDAELDLAEGVVLIVLEIRKRDFENTALERIVRVLQTAGAVDDGLSDASRILVSSNVRHFEVRVGQLYIGAALTLGPGR